MTTPGKPSRYIIGLSLFVLQCCFAQVHASEKLWFLPATADQPVVPKDVSAVVPANNILEQQMNATLLQELALDQGAYAPGLASGYLQHALSLQSTGRHEDALNALGRAAHHERLHEGLYSPGQDAIVKLEIASHIARGEYREAMQRQEYLLHLQQRLHGQDAVETIPARARLADFYLDNFRKVLLGEVRPDRLLPARGAQSFYLVPEDLAQHQLAYIWLKHAQNLYMESVRILVAHEAWSHPQLESLEQQLLQTYILHAFERRIALDPGNFLHVQDRMSRDTIRLDERHQQMVWYRFGVEAHERLINYHQLRGETDPAAIAEARLALADWHLLFGQNRRASATYRDVSTWLQKECDPALASQILQPVIPQQVPAFEGLFAHESPRELMGFVDVSFSIGKSGKVKNIAMLDASENMDAKLVRMLERQLRRAPFRPGIAADGSLQKEQQVKVRYHLARSS